MTTFDQSAYQYLKEDEHLGVFVSQYGPIELKGKPHPWLYLCYSVMSQQLSTKVALVLKKRFNEIYSGKPTAEKVRNTSFETLKSIGLSTSKANTIIEIANYAETPWLSKQKMVRSSNEGVIAHVIPIKGVGKWTAEMMLMFCLGRPDIIAVDDLGIQKGMKQLFDWEDIPRKELCTKMVEEAEKWSPFRTYACMYILRMLDSA